MKVLSDLNGDGRAEILATGPEGASNGIYFGVLGCNNGAFTMEAAVPAALLGFSGLDACSLVGDIDGDGIAEVFVSGPDGAGVIKFANNATNWLFHQGNGTAWGGWRIDTTNNEFGPIADFDGDGRADLLVTSPWGVAVLTTTTTGFLTPICVSNGTVFGSWTVDTTDDAFGSAADFDGDGRAEIVMSNSQGLFLIKLTSNNQGVVFSVVGSLLNGTDLAGWSFDATAISLGPVADFDGDGKAEQLLVTPQGIVVLKLVGSAFAAATSVTFGDWIDGWRLGGGDRIGPAADFDGDGNAEMLIQSGWGLGVLRMTGGALHAYGVTPTGARLGQWALDIPNNRLIRAADFDGDGKAELFVTSLWGIGLLDLSGAAPTSKAMAANGTVFGNWTLQTSVNDFEQARGRGIVLHNGGSGPGYVSTLQSRGYTVVVSGDGPTLRKAIRRFGVSLGPGDRLFVGFWTDGGQTPRPYGDATSKTWCAYHSLGTNTGGDLTLGDFTPYFSRLAVMGADVTVYDSSCHGGETVVAAMGERYCAMSTTGVYEVAVRYSPDPQAIMAAEQKPGAFSPWYLPPPRYAGSLLNASIIQVASNPTTEQNRIQQRLFRNDSAPTVAITILARDALRALLYASPWYVTTAGCYLSQYVDPGNYNAGCTGSLASFEDFLNSTVPPQLQAIADYKTHLLTSANQDQAAAIYYANFDSCWRAAAQDETWDPQANPHQHASAMFGVDPTRYPLSTGFNNLVYDINSALYEMQAEYDTQLQSLQALDAAVKAQAKQGKMPKPVIKHVPTFKLSSVNVNTYADAWSPGIIKVPSDTPQSIADILATYSQAYTNYLSLCCSASIIMSMLEDSFIAFELGGKPTTGDFVYY